MSENRFERLLLGALVPERWGASIFGDFDEEWSRKRSGGAAKHIDIRGVQADHAWKLSHSPSLSRRCRHRNSRRRAGGKGRGPAITIAWIVGLKAASACDSAASCAH